MKTKPRVVIFTTPTKHHTYFINKINSTCDIVAIFYEGRRVSKSYPTGPFFAEEEDAFEEKFFDMAFDGAAREFPREIEQRIVTVHDVNQPGVAEHVAALRPQLGLTYGVGRVKSKLFTQPSWGTINIHRGIVQRYRGLDSDLWAAYDGAFDAIGVTVHYLNENLDTGEILAEETISVDTCDRIYHMRYKTSVTATKLVLQLIPRFAECGGPLPGRKQGRPGPYYSAMSLADKHIAAERFDAYVKKLSAE